MGSKFLGTEYVCDGCGKTQVIVIDGNKPNGWTRGHLRIVSGYDGPDMYFCETCWTPSVNDKKEKRALMVRLLKQLGVIK